MKLNLTNLLTTGAICYVCFCAWNLYTIFFPQDCNESKGCLVPGWSPSDKCKLELSFISAKPSNQVHITKSSFIIENGVTLPLNVSPPIVVYQNGSADARIRFFLNDEKPFLIKDVQLTSYREPIQTPFNLLDNQDKTQRSNINSTGDPITFWLSALRIYILKAPNRFTISELPAELGSLFRTRKLGAHVAYSPLIYVNTHMQPTKDWVEVSKQPVGDGAEYPPLDFTLSVEALSIGRFRMHAMLELMGQQMRTFGMKAKDIDEVRGLLLDTNYYLLLTTVFVSVFHMLFDFLAFKNDIAFWRRAENTAGLSVRTVIWRFFSSLVIFLHLREERSSLLVVVPMGISSCIEFWKLTRLFKVSFSLRHGIRCGQRSKAEKATDLLDAQFMFWLVMLMLPLCVAGAIYSLIYLPHRSWLSWCLQTLVHGVYAFGFLLMTPQLFLNYRLKSVAHLPWKALTYKAFNTFIDDFFAMIIVMPTAHRIACLRDDFIFLIYLYQRWLYPVDKSRVNEFGQSGTDGDDVYSSQLKDSAQQDSDEQEGKKER